MSDTSPLIEMSDEDLGIRAFSSESMMKENLKFLVARHYFIKIL